MSELLLNKIGTVRRKRVGVKLIAGLCAIVVWSVVLLAITMAVDWWMELPYWMRALSLAVNLAGIAYFAFVQTIAPILWGPDDDDLALLVESSEPSLQNRLISSIQLTRSADSYTSPSLVEALVRQTEQLAEPMNFAGVIPTDKVLKLLSAAVLVLSLSAVGYAITLPASTDLLKRAMLVPGVAVPRKTQVEVITGDVVVARGDAVELSARARGVIPKSGIVQMEFPSGARQEFPLDAMSEDPGKFSRTIENVQDSFKYVVKLNDGVSTQHTVRVEPRPVVARLECLQVYPDYTNLGTVRRQPGDLTLLAGSRLVVNVQASKRLKITSEEDASGNRMKLAGSNIGYWLQSDINDLTKLRSRSAGADAVILPPQTTGMSIDLIDEFGIRSKDTAVYRVDLVADKAPTVTVTNPTRKEELVTRRATVIVGFEAADDFGLSAVALKYKLSDGPEKSIPLDAAGSPRNLRGYYNWDLSKLSPQLEHEQIVEWWIEVRDGNNVTGPGVTSSEHYQLRVVTEDEKRAELLNRLNDAMSQINDVSENQNDVAQRLGKMITEQGAEK